MREENNFTQEASQVNQNTSSEATTNLEDGISDASSQDNDTVTVTNANCASIKNDQDVSSTSGNNDASDNEGSKLNTGDTSSDSSLINEGNKNTTSGDQQLEATNLDDQGSSTDTNSESSEKVSVDNDNQIYAENDVNVEVRTQKLSQLLLFTESLGFFVLKKMQEKNIHGIPVLLDSEIDELENYKDFYKLVKERS